MINKTTFAYAITNIDDDLVTEFAPDTSNRVGAATKRRASSYYIKAVAAALGLTAAITAVAVFGVFKSPTENSPETVDRALLASETDPETAAVLQTDETEAESENNAETEKDGIPLTIYEKYSVIIPTQYIKHGEESSLAMVKLVKCCGVYYGGVKDSDGKLKQKYLVYEATVEKDYYENLKQGDTVYVAFSLRFSYYGDGHSINYSYLDDVKLKEIVSKWDSFIYYIDYIRNTGSRDYPLWETDTVQDNEDNSVEFFALGICRFTDGIIPIVDSAVDYTSIDSLPNLPASRGMFITYFCDIKRSGYSICQGDTIEKISETIKKLISKQVFGECPDINYVSDVYLDPDCYLP